MSEEEPKVKTPDEIDGEVHEFENEECGKVRYADELDRDPVMVKEETILKEDRIAKGVVEKKELSHRLDELTKDFYLFNLYPIYLVLGSDSTFDLVYQYGAFIGVDKIEDVISYKAPSPLFDGLGDHCCSLTGIPKHHKSKFRKFIVQTVYPDHRYGEQTYWRPKCYELGMVTPGTVSAPAPVDVFALSGAACEFYPAPKDNGLFTFFKRQPDKEIVAEANRFFAKIGE